MPTIRVELFPGRSAAQKRAFAQAVTEAAVQTLGGTREGVDVIFVEIDRQNWASGGQLWSDKTPAPPAAG